MQLLYRQYGGGFGGLICFKEKQASFFNSKPASISALYLFVVSGLFRVSVDNNKPFVDIFVQLCTDVAGNMWTFLCNREGSIVQRWTLLC